MNKVQEVLNTTLSLLPSTSKMSRYTFKAHVRSALMATKCIEDLATFCRTAARCIRKLTVASRDCSRPSKTENLMKLSNVAVELFSSRYAITAIGTSRNARFSTNGLPCDAF